MNQEMNDRELRSFALVELRASQDGEPAVLEGTAAVYNRPARINTGMGEFIEIIEPGFFESVLGDDVRALWNHNDDLVLGRTKSGTLRLVDRPGGLGVVIHPPATQAGRDALLSVRRGDVDQMSFAFSVWQGQDEWKENEEGIMVRRLKRGACKKLYDVSPVTFPAYEHTTISARARQMATKTDSSRSHNSTRRLRIELLKLY